MTRKLPLLAALALVLSAACGVPEDDIASTQQALSGQPAGVPADTASTPADTNWGEASATMKCRTRCGNKICTVGKPCYTRCCSYIGEACSGGNIYGSCWNSDPDNHGLCGKVRDC